VVDFGVMAYENRNPPSVARLEHCVEGEFYLGIDPFFYFEDLYALPGIPTLQYHWQIKSISLETTPWLTNVNSAGGTTLSRDETRESFQEVAATNAWADDEGHAHYLLECERIT